MQTAITRTSGPGRVLLVDDHPAIRRVLRSLLEEVDRLELPDQAPGVGGPGREPPGPRDRPNAMNASKHLRRLAGLLLAGLLLAACRGPHRGGGGPAQGATPLPPPRPGQATGPARPSRKVTVTGTVRAGVEPGCRLLDADGGGPYLLVGGERARLRPGARVAVT